MNHRPEIGARIMRSVGQSEHARTGHTGTVTEHCSRDLTHCVKVRWDHDGYHSIIAYSMLSPIHGNDIHDRIAHKAATQELVL